jgi:nucleoid-associated protein YgaU
MDLKKILKQLKLSEQTMSTILGALVIIVIGILIFNYFQKNQTQVSNTAVNTTEEENGSVQLVEENGEMVPQGLPTTHVVVAGENLWTISQTYYGSGYNWVDIAKENKLTNANKLLVGQELSIPKTAVKQVVVAKVDNQIAGASYTVVKGDSVWKIAVRAYGDGFQWVAIAKANNLVNPNVIVPGQVLTLPR